MDKNGIFGPYVNFLADHFSASLFMTYLDKYVVWLIFARIINNIVISTYSYLEKLDFFDHLLQDTFDLKFTGEVTVILSYWSLTLQLSLRKCMSTRNSHRSTLLTGVVPLNSS